MKVRHVWILRVLSAGGGLTIAEIAKRLPPDAQSTEWEGTPAQVRGAVRWLFERGLVAKDSLLQEGEPTHSITTAGKAELEDWV